MIFYPYSNAITFKGFDDIYNDAIAFADKIKDMGFTKIVGIANSGSYIAYTVAEALSLPLEILYSGSGKVKLDDATLPKADQHTLFIDDTVSSGTRMKVVQSYYKFPIKFGCLYIKRTANRMVPDVYLDVIPCKRYFFYNVLKHIESRYFAWDMDGLICYNPKHLDTTQAYADELINIKPLNLPAVPILAIVTARMACHRDVTVRWLRDHNVRYKHLIMCSDRELRKNSKFKIDALNLLKTTENLWMYIDSDVKYGANISKHIDFVGVYAKSP